MCYIRFDGITEVFKEIREDVFNRVYMFVKTSINGVAQDIERCCHKGKA